MKTIKHFQDGSLLQSDTGYHFKDVDGLSNRFDSALEATEEYYIKQARDHYGTAVRDNRRIELISLGKDVDDGNIE